MKKDYTIAVAGTGYVGLSIATLLSQHHKVMAVDIVKEKVDLINNRKSPIQDDYIEKYLAEKDLNLTATLDAMLKCYPNNKIPMSVWHQMYSMKIIKKYKLAFCSEREFISEDIIFQIDYFSKAKSVVLLEETLYFYYCSQVGSLSTKYRENRYLEEVRLSKELFRKLAIIFPEEVYKIQLQGMFLGRVRTCLMMEYLNENNKNFNMIIEDKYLKKIINDYPIERCKLSLRIFYYCIKQEWSTIIRILLHIRKMKK